MVNNILNQLNSDANLNSKLNEYLSQDPQHFLNIECNYINEEEFCLGGDQAGDKILLMNLNVCSLNAKFDELCNMLQAYTLNKCRPDIICIQEVWQCNISNFNIPGFKLHSKLRSKGQGGGVALYLADNLKLELMESPFIENIYESLSCKIELPNKERIIVVSLYRPNNHSILNQRQQIDEFFLHFQKHIETLKKSNLPIFICSDSNIDLLKCGTNEMSNTYAELLSTFGFHQLISKASRITADTFSAIDHICFDGNEQKIKKAGIIIDSCSDHFVSYVYLNLKRSSSQTPILKRQFTEARQVRFINEISEIEWDDVLASNCSNEASNIFCNRFFEIFNNNFPLVSIKKNKNFHPLNEFMSKGLLISRRKKMVLARKIKRDKSEILLAYYRTYRNIYNRLIKASKKAHFYRKIENSNGNSKVIWNTINEALNNNSNSASIESIMSEGELISDNIEISNVFNSHFSNIGASVSNRAPKVTKDFMDYLPPPQPRSIFLKPTSPIEIVNTVIHMNSKKSTDINDLSIYLLKKVIQYVASPLSHIINLSLETGRFPDAFKITKCIPIFKNKGSRLDPNNYRGISIINCFSKIFEKILSEQLITFLNENDFFDHKQFGFLRNRSTNMALIRLLNEITSAINEDKIALLTCLDVEKAFDSIRHDKLLLKLKNAGIRGLPLDLFTSYLQNRTQKVKIGNFISSNTCDISISVMQGSVLGVVLFLIYINDIKNSSDMFSIIYADDINSLLVCKDLDELIEQANIELNKLILWYSANNLKIHPGKSKCMIFKSRFKSLSINTCLGNLYLPIFLNMNDEQKHDVTKVIPIRLVPNTEESSIKILGVLIDQDLSFRYQMQALQAKLSRAIFSLNFTKQFLDKKLLKLIYYAHFHSHLNYCINLLSALNITDLNKLILIQKKAIRIVCGVGFLEHTRPLFIQENILPIESLITLEIAKFMYDYLNLRLPPCFDRTWIMNWEIREGNLSLRNDWDFAISRFKYVYISKLPLFLFPRIWNDLDESLKFVSSKHLFGKKLKEKLIAQI